MFKSLQKLYKNKIETTDGEVGTVRDFYIDDQSWVIRYVIVDINSTTDGRQVLLSPAGNVH